MYGLIKGIPFFQYAIIAPPAILVPYSILVALGQADPVIPTIFFDIKVK